MGLSYTPHHVVHAHLPCPPSISNSIPELHIPSDSSPVNDKDESLHPDHALSFSYKFDLNVIARVVQNGYALELRPLDTVYHPTPSREENGSPTIRVVFPSPIKSLPESSIIVSRPDRKVYILVYTEENVLYRLNFPLGGTDVGRGSRFSFTTRGNDDWCEEVGVGEDILTACGGISTWAVVDELNVVLGGMDGGLIRLTRSSRGLDGTWGVEHHRVSSRFGRLFSSKTSEEQILSFAILPIDEDLALVYTLSRDRKLRTWNGFTGALLKTIDAKIPSSSRELVLNARPSPSASSSSPLLDTALVPLIRLVASPSPSSNVSHLVVVFLATPSSTSTPGSFLVYRVGRANTGSDMTLVGDRPCSAHPVGFELRGFEVLPSVRQGDYDSGRKLWVAWDQKGSRTCESIVMDDLFQFTTTLHNTDSSSFLYEWHRASHTSDVDSFDPAYFDNLLSLDPPEPTLPHENRDIGRTFTEHLFYPGRFSMLSLTTALDEFIAQLPQNKAYAQTSQSYPSLASKYEQIVGCHLQMDTNPSTGAAEVQEYRSKLKLQWLGVWARVRNLDSAARWPIGTALLDDDQFLVVAREGYSTVVPQDTCAYVNTLAEMDDTEGFVTLPNTALLPVLSDLELPSTRWNAIAISTAGDHIAKALSDIAHDEQNGSALLVLMESINSILAQGREDVEVSASRLWSEDITPCLDDEVLVEVRRTLSDSNDLLQGLHEILNMLASTPTSLLGEPEQQLRFSGIGNALATDDIATTIRARHQLARNALLVVIFAVGAVWAPDNQLGNASWVSPDTDEGEMTIQLLAQAFTTYQRYRVLNFVTEQSADESKTRDNRKSLKRRHGDDEPAEPFGSSRTQVAAGNVDVDEYETAYSLIHCLLARALAPEVCNGVLGEIGDARATLLEYTLSLYPGIWESTPLQKDVQLAFDILQDGHPVPAGRITSFYPPSSGMFYVRARAYLEMGEIDEAIRHFEQAASGCRDGSLGFIIPHTAGENGLREYYRHVTRLFEDRGVEQPIIRFGNLALQSTTPADPAVKDIWTKVFLAATSLGDYNQAYVTLTSTPDINLRLDFLGQFLSAMCEANEVGQLLRFGFVGFQKEVESQLGFKAQHSDPLKAPYYHQVLYSWHVTRGDFRSAADVMYQQSKRLEMTRKGRGFTVFDIAVKRASSLLAAINALSLLDKRQAWLATSVSSSRGVKRKRVTSYIPEEKFAQSSSALEEVITLKDIQAEYAAILARLQLAEEIPALLEHGDHVEASDVVNLLISRGSFDEAQSSGSKANVDLSDLFSAVAQRCVQLSKSHDNAYLAESPSASWLYKSPITSHLQGPPGALALRYLQVALTRHDSVKTNWRYRQIVAEEFFSMNNEMKSGWRMPNWLVEWEMGRDPEGWIGRAVKHGWIAEAVEWSLDWLTKATPPELLPKRADAAYTPYNLFDRVLQATKEGLEKDDDEVQKQAEKLREAITRRIHGLAKVKLTK